MGRSRGAFHADEDPTQRSRRRKSTSAGDTLETLLAGQGSSDGQKALYHCNYCSKDITGRIRIKCAMCSDFDLCVECFSVGAELTPHKSDHPYRVMDNMSVPLICPDWNAGEEMLLLEGLEMYGLENWLEVAEHVGTKSKEQCMMHYRSVYLDSPFYPLPDMSHVAGKNRNELFAMAEGSNGDQKGLTSSTGDLSLKEMLPPFSPSNVKVEGPQKGGPSGRLLSTQNTGQHIGRKSGGKTPNSPADGNTSLIKLSGFNAKRQEFDPEYDNDAEQLLNDLEFKDDDTEDEREIKLRILRIFSKRYNERMRRKDFIIERNLLCENPIEKGLSPEEKELCRRYDPFMRFQSKKEHDDLLETVISEYRVRKRIQELKEAQAAGCRTSAEADRYHAHKRRETEERERRAKEGARFGDPNTVKNDVDMMRYPGAELLAEAEKQLCRELGILPHQYLKMQEILSMNIFSGNVSNTSDARRLLNVIEPSKVDRVFDMLVRKGVAPA